MKLLAALFAALCLLACAARACADERWLVISDIHLNPYDRSSFPSSWGSDSNLALLDSAIAQMKRADPNPAVVVIAGDFLAHHFARLARSNGAGAEIAAIVANRTIAGRFSRAFPQAAFIITLGNNDDYCGDYRSDAGGSYQRALERLWAPLIDRGGSRTTFADSFVRGGYYIVHRAHPPLRVVVLNDVPWSLFYQGTCKAGRGIAAAERAWLSHELRAGAPTIVLAHIPPGIDPRASQELHGIVALPFLKPTDERALEAALHPKRVVWALFGHAHRNDVRIVGKTPALIVSSLSPVYDNNPAFYELDLNGRGELHDMQTTIFDEAQGSWRTIASFDHDFGVGSFDLAALQSIHERIATDPAYRDRWSARYVSDSEQAPENRNAMSLRYAWCAQELGFKRFLACAPSRARTTLVTIAIVLAIVLALAIAVVFALLAMRQARNHR